MCLKMLTDKWRIRLSKYQMEQYLIAMRLKRVNRVVLITFLYHFLYEEVFLTKFQIFLLFLVQILFKTMLIKLQTTQWVLKFIAVWQSVYQILVIKEVIPVLLAQVQNNQVEEFDQFVKENQWGFTQGFNHYV